MASPNHHEAMHPPSEHQSRPPVRDDNATVSDKEASSIAPLDRNDSANNQTHTHNSRPNSNHHETASLEQVGPQQPEQPNTVMEDAATQLETAPAAEEYQTDNNAGSASSSLPPPLHLAEEQVLEVDDIDSDSALGSDTSSVTQSLSESIYNYRREHGRTYHAYKDGKYIFPNDEREADRLDLQHHIIQLTYGDNLHFAPLKGPKRAIDIGTGTGIWAIDFADQYPDCQVIGIDLSPGQPTLVPPNLKFIIDDAEDQWIFDQPFDYIHARLMNGSFEDWPKFFRQAYENLEPGGWLEVQDYGLPVRSADGTHLNTDLTRWGELLCEASAALGKLMGSDCSEKHMQWMRDAGFLDVQQKMFMWPTNSWPKDPTMKEIGRWVQVNILDGLEGFCLALLTRGLGWKKEEVDVFVARVSRDLQDRKIHAYFPMPIVYGRKPFGHEVVFH